MPPKLCVCSRPSGGRGSQVVASGCKWPQVIASGRDWPQVAAGSRSEPVAAKGHKWPQPVVFPDIELRNQNTHCQIIWLLIFFFGFWDSCQFPGLCFISCLIFSSCFVDHVMIHPWKLFYSFGFPSSRGDSKWILQETATFGNLAIRRCIGMSLLPHMYR